MVQRGKSKTSPIQTLGPNPQETEENNEKNNISNPEFTPEEWETYDEIEVKEEELSDGMEDERVHIGNSENTLIQKLRPNPKETEEKNEINTSKPDANNRNGCPSGKRINKSQLESPVNKRVCKFTPQEWETTKETEVKEDETSDGMGSEMMLTERVRDSPTQTHTPKPREIEEKNENKNQTNKTEVNKRNGCSLRKRINKSQLEGNERGCKFTPQEWETTKETEVKEDETSDGMESEMILTGRVRDSPTRTHTPKPREIGEKNENKNQTNKTEGNKRNGYSLRKRINKSQLEGNERGCKFTPQEWEMTKDTEAKEDETSDGMESEMMLTGRERDSPTRTHTPKPREIREKNENKNQTNKTKVNKRNGCSLRKRINKSQLEGNERGCKFTPQEWETTKETEAKEDETSDGMESEMMLTGRERDSPTRTHTSKPREIGEKNENKNQTNKTEVNKRNGCSLRKRINKSQLEGNERGCKFTPQEWETTKETEAKEDETSDGMESEMMLTGRVRDSPTWTLTPKTQEIEEKNEHENQTNKTKLVNEGQTIFRKKKEKGLEEITMDVKQGRSTTNMTAGKERKTYTRALGIKRNGTQRVYTNRKNSNKVLHFPSARLSKENHSHQESFSVAGTPVFDKTPEKENSQSNLPVTVHQNLKLKESCLSVLAGNKIGFKEDTKSTVKQISNNVFIQQQTGFTVLSNRPPCTNHQKSSGSPEASAPSCDSVTLEDPSSLVLRSLPIDNQICPKLSGKFGSERQSPSESVALDQRLTENSTNSARLLKAWLESPSGCSEDDANTMPAINKLDNTSLINSSCDNATVQAVVEGNSLSLPQDESLGVKLVDKLPVTKFKNSDLMIPKVGSVSSVPTIAAAHNDLVGLELNSFSSLPMNIPTQGKSTLKRNDETDENLCHCPSAEGTFVSADIATSASESQEDDTLIQVLPELCENCENPNSESLLFQGREQFLLGSLDLVHPLDLENTKKYDGCSEGHTGPWRYLFHGKRMRDKKTLENNEKL